MIVNASRGTRWAVHTMGCRDPHYAGLDFGPDQSLDIICAGCGARRPYWTQGEGFVGDDLLTSDATTELAIRSTGSPVSRESRP